jgi:predicted enzyme related to lactoylglutathione lyase
MKEIIFCAAFLASALSFASEKENYRMLDIQGFNVAAIYAADLEKSVKFYSEVLGFEKQAEMGGGVQMKLNRDPNLTIYLQGGYARDSRDYENSKVSLSFHTSSVKSALSKVREMGLKINLDYVEVGPNYAMFCFQDPSGNQIMLMGAP